MAEIVGEASRVHRAARGGRKSVILRILHAVFAGSGNRRTLLPWQRNVAASLAVAIAVYHLAMILGGYWGLDPTAFLWSHVGSFLVLVFLYFGAGRRNSARLDGEGWFLIGLSAALLIYLFHHQERILHRAQLGLDPSGLDIVAGGILFLLVCEATRRVAGMPLVWVTGAFIAYNVLGPIFPGLWRHEGVTLPRLISGLSMGVLGEGLWALPTELSSTVIITLVLFGGIISALGAGEMFLDLANALLGNQRGGPAKVAVVASAAFGTVSGGAPSNVAVTGTVTIPAMKRAGYPPHYAGAVEAVASTGGAITPPVMGATIFIMAELVGIPYSKLLLPAAIPALLYYWAFFLQVDLESAKMGIHGLPRESLPKPGKVLLRQGEFILPVLVLVYFILMGLTVYMAAIYATAASLLVGLLRGGSVPGYLRKLWKGTVDAMATMLVVVFPIALAGVILTSIGSSGFGSKFAHLISLATGQSLFLALVLGALMSLLLGMLTSITVSYILVVFLVIPVAVQIGVLPMVAHFFSLYFASMGYITPPVAIACFVAAAISGAEGMRIGLTAMRLAIAAFILPFTFVYHQGLLLIGSAGEILWALMTTGAGFTVLAVALAGWLSGPLGFFQRLLLAASAIALFWPSVQINILGAATGGTTAAILGRWWRWRAESLLRPGRQDVSGGSR